MGQNILLAELTKNCEGKKEKLMDLMEAFDLACLGYDMREQHLKDIYNRVLRENEFYADKNTCRLGINAGDRVTDENSLYLLSEKDFNKVMELARPIFVKEKVTNEKGYFLENWTEIRQKAREELVSFLIYEIIPENMRYNFDSCRWNVVHSDKLINVFRNLAKKAA